MHAASAGRWRWRASSPPYAAAAHRAGDQSDLSDLRRCCFETKIIETMIKNRFQTGRTGSRRDGTASSSRSSRAPAAGGPAWSFGGRNHRGAGARRARPKAGGVAEGGTIPWVNPAMQVVVFRAYVGHARRQGPRWPLRRVPCANDPRAAPGAGTPSPRAWPGAARRAEGWKDARAG